MGHAFPALIGSEILSGICPYYMGGGIASCIVPSWVSYDVKVAEAYKSNVCNSKDAYGCCSLYRELHCNA